MKLDVAPDGMAQQLTLAMPTTPAHAVAFPPPTTLLPEPPTVWPATIRARTLHQLYAGLVAAVPPGGHVGLKSIETRKSRTTPGLLVICAGQMTDGDAWHRLFDRIPLWAHKTIEPIGSALALVHIAEIRRLEPEDEPRAWFYAPGRWAWVIDRCWPLRPFPVRGMPGEFQLDSRLVREALR